MEKIIIIGASGHASSVIECIESKKEFEIVGLIDKNFDKSHNLLNYNVIGNDDYLIDLYKSNIRYAFIGVGTIGNTNIKIKIVENLLKIGFIIPNIIDKSALVSQSAKIGQGVFVGKGAIINANVVIKSHAIINTKSVVEHNSIVNEYAHIAPSATVLGNCKIGANTHIGANSTIIQSVEIGSNVMVGAGAVVTKNILDNTKVAGNPAKIMR